MLPVLSAALLDKQHSKRSNNNSNNEKHISSSSRSSSNSSDSHSTPKRTPSMIFRIEQLLPTTQTGTPTHSTSSRQRHDLRTTSATATTTTTTLMRMLRQTPPMQCHIPNVRSGVHVAQFTPKDTYSEVVDTEALMSAPGAAHTTPGQQNERSYCTMLASEVLSMSAAVMRKIKLSEDVYSYNALFELYSGQVRMRIVRDVAPEDELVAWFGEELTLLMGIPFLTPLNIQGNNRYMCHLCHLTFETPHPLKIHLALGCGRNALDILWIRLHYALQASTSTATTMSAQNSPAHAPSSSSSISPAGSPTPAPQHTKGSAARFSAFRPIGSGSVAPASLLPLSLPLPTMPHISLPITMHSTASPITTHTTTLSYLPTITSHAASFPPLGLLQSSSTTPLNAAAQIEAIVSNMGASKQGHLCIYCGKVYSRKYGLKIHIRTHTGFKPLKCKFCMRPFGDPSNLNKHLRLHLQSNANADGSGTNEGYQCHLCHKTLLRRRDLQRHIETRHNQDDANEQHTTDREKNA